MVGTRIPSTGRMCLTEFIDVWMLIFEEEWSNQLIHGLKAPESSETLSAWAQCRRSLLCIDSPNLLHINLGRQTQSRVFKNALVDLWCCILERYVQVERGYLRFQMVQRFRQKGPRILTPPIIILAIELKNCSYRGIYMYVCICSWLYVNRYKGSKQRHKCDTEGLDSML